MAYLELLFLLQLLGFYIEISGSPEVNLHKSNFFCQKIEKLFILAFNPNPVLIACSTQNLFITGNMPGIAASTKLTCEFGS